MKGPKWRWANGQRGKKKILTLSGHGNQTDSIIYDVRGGIAINLFHRNQDDKMNKRLARHELRDLFRQYGKNLVIIGQYGNEYNTQVYFRYENTPPEELVGQWVGQIKEILNEC
jgi:hypothetical protein